VQNVRECRKRILIWIVAGGDGEDGSEVRGHGGPALNYGGGTVDKKFYQDLR
jgi:hypothetical protein